MLTLAPAPPASRLTVIENRISRLTEMTARLEAEKVELLDADDAYLPPFVD